MCGLAGVVGSNAILSHENKKGIQPILHHRGPDSFQTFLSENKEVALFHWRLKIIDLSDTANQPMTSPCGRYTLVFNGEIYNYEELKAEYQAHYQFTTKADTEVLLAGFILDGVSMLDKLKGMFAFSVWDNEDKSLFMARDRFGVKPFYYTLINNQFYFASEIKAVNYLKGEKSFNESTWANYFRHGSYGNDETTFYKDVLQLKAGHYQVYKSGKLLTTKWYHFNTTGYDGDDNNLIQKFDTLLKKAVGYRFVSDVPVGVNLSGGIDSSALTYLTTKENPLINAFTFYTGDERYDELPWVEKLLENTRVAWHKVKLSSQEIPDLANKISQIQDEPFGGIPTLAYAKLFQEAKHLGIKVVLDGQGMDEQLGGYDYYYKQGQSVVQGATSRATIPEACLLDVEQTKEQVHLTFKDELLQKQYIDLFHKKLPRALRFNDRISMASSVELREPFLDHNLVEWSFHLPLIYKYANHKTKALLRSYLSQKLPGNIVEAPKRPLQTPQREWLRNELKEWSVDMINVALTTGWLNKTVVEKEMQHFWQGKSDNSFYIWQWINLGLLVNETR